ncbi:MAG: hypothetical protein QMD92_04510 [bacterium]|nr:hypothetical protein [bacterium]
MVIHSIDAQQFKLIVSKEDFTQLEKKVEEGEIIRCQVKATLKQGKVLINLKGTNFVASTDLSFNQGEIVDLQVKELAPKIILQLIPHRESSAFVSKYTQIDIKNILKSLDLPINKENMGIVKKLLEYNLPLNKETISEIISNLSNLGSKNLLDIETLVFLKAKNIPFSRSAFNALKLYLFEKTPLASHLNKLKKELLDSPVDKDLKQQLTKFLDQLNIPFKKNNLPFDLKNFLSNLGLNVNPDTLKEKEEVNLKNLLLNLKQRLITDSKDSPHPRITNLLETVDQTLLNLVSLQLLNQDKGNLRFFYWEIPYQMASQKEPVKIKIKYQEKKKEEQIDLDNLNISFLFKTSGLGDVLVNIHMKDRAINGYISLEDFIKKNFAVGHIKELQSKLSNLGYLANKIDCKIIPHPEQEFHEDRILNLDNLSKIDIRI